MPNGKRRIVCGGGAFSSAGRVFPAARGLALPTGCPAGALGRNCELPEARLPGRGFSDRALPENLHRNHAAGVRRRSPASTPAGRRPRAGNVLPGWFGLRNCGPARAGVLRGLSEGGCGRSKRRVAVFGQRGGSSSSGREQRGRRGLVLAFDLRPLRCARS